uniref:cysteinyl leukotriene receptor 2-like n=1 Tax=Pristiophorus japonicus TaxID=55135 RepID=UPI00398E9228
MNGTKFPDSDSCGDIDDFKTNAYPPTYIIVFILGSIENIFCLYVFLKLYKRKTASSVVMVNLAIADLLFVCTLPWRVHYYWQGRTWNLSNHFCAFLSYALYLNMYCSIYFLTLMSILRYFAIVHPFKGLKYRSIKNVQIICISIWVFVGVLASPFLKNGSYTNENNVTKCFDPKDETHSNIYVMNLISLVVGCIIPFFTITICYIFVVKTLLTSKAKHHKQNSSHRKAIAMIIIVMVIFLTSFLPYHIVRTVHLATKGNTENTCFFQKTVVVTLCGAVINSCLDPLLYYFAAETFRGKLKNSQRIPLGGTLALVHQT